MMKQNRLWGSISYLVGPMDRAPDGGVEWRNWITPHLQSKGIVVLNPCDKPTDAGGESLDDRDAHQKMIDDGNYGEVCKQMRIVRSYDLAMVDIASFLIVNIDLDIHTCGTYEEVCVANRQKQPILVRMKQGKSFSPHWLLGMIHHTYIFNSFDDILTYLAEVDEDNTGFFERAGRWKFFDRKRMMPTVPPANDLNWKPW